MPWWEYDYDYDYDYDSSEDESEDWLYRPATEIEIHDESEDESEVDSEDSYEYDSQDDQEDLRNYEEEPHLASHLDWDAWDIRFMRKAIIAGIWETIEGNGTPPLPTRPDKPRLDRYVTGKCRDDWELTCNRLEDFSAAYDVYVQKKAIYYERMRGVENLASFFRKTVSRDLWKKYCERGDGNLWTWYNQLWTGMDEERAKNPGDTTEQQEVARIERLEKNEARRVTRLAELQATKESVELGRIPRDEQEPELPIELWDKRSLYPLDLKGLVRAWGKVLPWDKEPVDLADLDDAGYDVERHVRQHIEDLDYMEKENYLGSGVPIRRVLCKEIDRLEDWIREREKIRTFSAKPFTIAQDMTTYGLDQSNSSATPQSAANDPDTTTQGVNKSNEPTQQIEAGRHPQARGLPAEENTSGVCSRCQKEMHLETQGSGQSNSPAQRPPATLPDTTTKGLDSSKNTNQQGPGIALDTTTQGLEQRQNPAQQTETQKQHAEAVRVHAENNTSRPSLSKKELQREAVRAKRVDLLPPAEYKKVVRGQTLPYDRFPDAITLPSPYDLRHLKEIRRLCGWRRSDAGSRHQYGDTLKDLQGKIQRHVELLKQVLPELEGDDDNMTMRLQKSVGLEVERLSKYLRRLDAEVGSRARRAAAVQAVSASEVPGAANKSGAAKKASTIPPTANNQTVVTAASTIPPTANNPTGAKEASTIPPTEPKKPESSPPAPQVDSLKRKLPTAELPEAKKLKTEEPTPAPAPAAATLLAVATVPATAPLPAAPSSSHPLSLVPTADEILSKVAHLLPPAVFKKEKEDGIISSVVSEGSFKLPSPFPFGFAKQVVGGRTVPYEQPGDTVRDVRCKVLEHTDALSRLLAEIQGARPEGSDGRDIREYLIKSEIDRLRTYRYETWRDEVWTRSRDFAATELDPQRERLYTVAHSTPALDSIEVCNCGGPQGA